MLRVRMSIPIAAAFLLGAASASAQTEAVALRPLDHDAYDIWNRISDQSLSRDGQWALFAISSEAGGRTLTVTEVDGTTRHAIERAESPEFDQDSRFVVFTIKPAKDVVEAEREKKTPAAKMTPDTLGILDLSDGGITRIARTRGFRMPEDAGGWLAYQLGRAPDEKADSAAADSTRAPGAVEEPRREPGVMPEPPAVAGSQAGGAKPAGTPAEPDSAPEHDREDGRPLVLRNLETGEERRLEDVVDYMFSKDGTSLVYSRSNESGDADGVYVMDTRTGAETTLLSGKGQYTQIAIDDEGRRVAFLSNVDEFAANQPSWKLYNWDGDADAAQVVAAPGMAGIPEGFWVSDNGAVRYSPNGERIFFGTSPRPEPKPEKSDDADDEKVVVDIWNWKDPLLQPMQLLQADREKRRTYQSVVHLNDDARIVQLERTDIPDVNVALRGDGDFAIGTSELPYRQEISWGEGGSDIYYIDVETGDAARILEYNRGNASLSPEGRYLTWFDGEEQAWYAMDVRSRDIVDISERIPHAVHNELHDSPSLPRAYGSPGWTSDDDRFLIYDRNDIWAVDPTGREEPRNITEGVGRRENLRFRYVRLDSEERAIDPSQDMLLSAFHLWTKADGFYRDRVEGTQPPVRVMMADKSFGTPRKAEDAATVLFTRSDFREFPDVWVSDLSFTNARRLSDANPQQSEYRWGNAELVDWRSADGELLQGVLYTPDGFDPSKKYPMMVYFYERLSDNLHGHVAPAAGRASINISFYVSRGYLVFTPDIPYRIGYPGESAFNAVVPGVLSLVDEGFVDEERIGVQGHSWGGYQIAYLITKTDMFRAAEAGAPVANMISAYGGIRWGSGMSRMFQYEKTQSRLGGSLWESPMRFIENSPIFWADKVNTPLLMMHNDNDGAVPWEQGIEYFVALRRLGKPVWMLNYNGEEHGLTKEVNRRDWTIRLQQFFDHYLMDAPAPVWLAEGVPATEKGRNLGLDLVTKPITN